MSSTGTGTGTGAGAGAGAGGALVAGGAFLAGVGLAFVTTFVGTSQLQPPVDKANGTGPNSQLLIYGNNGSPQ